MVSNKISLRKLIERVDAEFTVPLYQRRYVWSEPRTDGAPDSATRMMADLFDAYVGADECFLQSITLAGNEIVDGQQRLTFLRLLLMRLGQPDVFALRYACRPLAQAWMDGENVPPAASQDVYCFEKTLKIISAAMSEAVIDRERFIEFVLDRVTFLCVSAESGAQSLVAYKMVNGTKSRMHQCDLVKATLLSLCGAENTDLVADGMRSRCALEWENWIRWWNRADVVDFFRQDWEVASDSIEPQPIDLLLRLCLRSRSDAAFDRPFVYEEFRKCIDGVKVSRSTKALRFFKRLRLAQKRFEDALSTPESYNRIRAILLLQDAKSRFDFLHDYFVTAGIGLASLQEIYKYSFLGMTYDEIGRRDSAEGRFEELLASLSMADVYHTESKRDAYNLLLRLNIDEDIKLGRRFDFSIWDNRSLEHIYSKSKVWHRGPEGRPLDGNDNYIPMSVRQLEADDSYMMRDAIVNDDGMPLSEHCIGNLVLLYGQNNAAFGNASFTRKKMMFLTPGDLGVFQSRNLLHSVCVFAGNEWRERQIVDNYNLTLKNLKLYYGYR